MMNLFVVLLIFVCYNVSCAPITIPHIQSIHPSPHHSIRPSTSTSTAHISPQGKDNHPSIFKTKKPIQITHHAKQWPIPSDMKSHLRTSLLNRNEEEWKKAMVGSIRYMRSMQEAALWTEDVQLLQHLKQTHKDLDWIQGEYENLIIQEMVNNESNLEWIISKWKIPVLFKTNLISAYRSKDNASLLKWLRITIQHIKHLLV